MTVAPLVKTHISKPDDRGRRYFNMSFGVDNWNDVDVRVTDYDNPAFQVAKRMIHFTGLNIATAGSIGIVMLPGFDWLGSGCNIGRYITTLANDNSGIIPIDLTIPIDAIRQGDPTLVPPAYWFIIPTTGYAATDDIAFQLWGWIE